MSLIPTNPNHRSETTLTFHGREGLKARAGEDGGQGDQDGVGRERGGGWQRRVGKGSWMVCSRGGERDGGAGRGRGAADEGELGHPGRGCTAEATEGGGKDHRRLATAGERQWQMAVVGERERVADGRGRERRRWEGATMAGGFDGGDEWREERFGGLVG
ncbi:hypothetical protein GUJ93_ZPchr0004g38604 [Zizania palustris]|uniref:Uncharacterized protein n=1 Tax=Zizania palustris TaxID=103762 RepID=A0A8J5SL12_ZIZPA|nr:hypothetical protein GUJ93_ZPchr0004g38604 [Zizania palustris]